MFQCAGLYGNASPSCDKYTGGIPWSILVSLFQLTADTVHRSPSLTAPASTVRQKRIIAYEWGVQDLVCSPVVKTLATASLPLRRDTFMHSTAALSALDSPAAGLSAQFSHPQWQVVRLRHTDKGSRAITAERALEGVNVQAGYLSSIKSSRGVSLAWNYGFDNIEFSERFLLLPSTRFEWKAALLVLTYTSVSCKKGRSAETWSGSTRQHCDKRYMPGWIFHTPRYHPATRSLSGLVNWVQWAELTQLIYHNQEYAFKTS